MRLDVDDERRRAERGETVDRIEEAFARGVGGRETQHRKPRPDDAGRSMQNFGGGKSLGVNGGRLLELQRRLGCDGKGRLLGR